MAEINNPGLRVIARRIVSTPGFTSDQQGLRRALERYSTSVTPQQRVAFEQGLLVQFFMAVHAEYLRDLDREMRRPRTAETPRQPSVVDDAEDDASSGDEASGETEGLASVSVLKFRSESADYPPATQPGGQAEKPISAPDRETPRAFGPVTITTLPNRPAARVPIAVDPVWREECPAPKQSAPVQQRSRKVEGYRRMFPELTSPVALAGGIKPRGKFTPGDADERADQIRKQVDMWRTANAGDRSRIEGREKLNVRDRLAMAEREQNMRVLTAEDEQLAAAKRAMAELGCATIDELPDDALVECGFQRYAA